MKKMPKDGVVKVRGNHKDEGGRSSAGVSNPLAANRCSILIPLLGSGATKKGASHTQASEGKKAANTPLLSLSEGKEGASHC